MLLSSVRRGLIPVLLALFLVAAGCRAEAPREVPQALDVSVQVPNPTLDPQRDVTGASTTITQQLFAGLMRLDPATAEALPDLAVEPPAVSADGLTYTFVLRQDAIWVDQGGRPMAPITVDDVVFTIRRLCDNQTDPRLAILFYILKNCQAANTAQGTPDLEAIAVRAVDDHTVEFSLNEPAAWFPALLAHWAARPLPRAQVVRSSEWASDPRLLQTSGPYLLAQFQPGVGTGLVKNPLYYGAGSITIAQAAISFIPDPAPALSAYMQNRLDTAPVPLSMVGPLGNDPATRDQLRQRSDLCTDYLGFNTVKAPLNSREVRLALSYAVDRQALSTRIYAGAAVPAYHLTPPGAFGAPPASAAGARSDAAMARQQLARAGYPNGVGFPPITLMAQEGERNRQLAEALQEMWRATLGIEVQVELQPAAAFLDVLQRTTPLPRVPHVWLLGRCADFPDAHNFLAPTFHVGASPNHSRRVPSGFEELLDEAAATGDVELRRDLYARAEETLVVTEAAAAPLAHHVSHLVVKPWLNRDFLPFGGLHIRSWTVNMQTKLAAKTPTPAR